MIYWRRAVAVLVLLVPLAASGVLQHSIAQEDCPGGSTSTSCSDGGSAPGGSCDGNGGSGSSGGGGGACEDTGGPDPTRPPAPPPTRAPETVVVPARRPVPLRTAAPVVRRSPPPDRGGPAATNAQLAAWATHFQTTPEEVKSWFNPYSTNDTIGGEGSGKSLSPGEEYTISNNRAVRNGAAKAGSIDPRAGNTVEVSLHSTRVPLGSTTTDANGRFSVTVRIPTSTKLGRHFVVALAPNTKKGSVAFVYPVEVTEPEPVFNGAVPQSTTTRRSGPPWLMIELVLGSAMIAGLVVFRIRRSAMLRQRGSYGPA